MTTVIRTAALATSALLHALMVWWLKASPHLPPREEPQPIQIEMVEAKPSGQDLKARQQETRSANRSSAISRTISGPTAKQLPLSALTPKHTITREATRRALDWTDAEEEPTVPRNAGTAASEDRIATGNERGVSGSGWGSGIAAPLKHLEQANHLRQLLTETQGLLFYPPRLGQHDIQVTINARVIFAPDHHCDWARTRIWGAERHLHVYVLALLKKLCSLNSVAALNFNANQEVDFSFAFTITEFTLNQLQEEQGDQLIGNSLRFERIFPKSVLQWHAGPLMGHFLVPAIYVDFAWLQEKWEQYVEGKDPLREFRETR